MLKLSILAIVIPVSMSVAGCWPLFTPIQPSNGAAPHPVAQPMPRSRASTAGDRTEKTARRRVVRPTPKTASEDRRPSTQTAVPVNPSSVTLAGDDDSRANAERLLDEVDHRLAAINRAKLSPASAATYDEANQFQSSAHQALAARDYLVASGLAEKASVLATRVENSSAAAH